MIIKSCSRPLLPSDYTVLLIYTEILIFVVIKSVACLHTTVFNTIFRVILRILAITLVCLIITPNMVFDYACRLDSKSSGTWSDMIIEQSLMRSGKTHGALINIAHKESAQTKWLLTVHVIAQYNEALRSLTNIFTGTWSEQHREMNASYMKRDNEHLQLFLDFLKPCPH